MATARISCREPIAGSDSVTLKPCVMPTPVIVAIVVPVGRRKTIGASRKVWPPTLKILAVAPKRRFDICSPLIGKDEGHSRLVRLTILRLSGGGERERSDRPLRPSATAGYPATRCALKARRATAAPTG